MPFPFLASLAIYGLVGGTVSAINGGDFLRGAFSGLLFGGAGGLMGASFAPAASGAAGAASSTTVSIFGREVSKQFLYQAAGGALGGIMAGMQVANAEKVARQMKARRDALAQSEQAANRYAEDLEKKYARLVGSYTSGKDKEVKESLLSSRRREDANEAFFLSLDINEDVNLSDRIGGFYGEENLEGIYV